MKTKVEKSCFACGASLGSCIRCKAEKLNKTRRLFGLPLVALSWLTLIFVAVVVLIFWGQ